MLQTMFPKSIPYQIGKFNPPQSFINPSQLFDPTTFKEQLFYLAVQNQFDLQTLSKLNEYQLSKLFKIKGDQLMMLQNELKLLQFYVGLQWALKTPLKQDIVISIAIHPNNKNFLIQLFNKTNIKYSIPPIKVQLHIMNTQEHILLEHIFFYGHDCTILSSPIEIVRIEARIYIPAMVVDINTNEIISCEHEGKVELIQDIKLTNNLQTLKNKQPALQQQQTDLTQQKRFQYEDILEKSQL